MATTSALIRDDPCPGCGTPLWYSFEPDAGCQRCVDGNTLPRPVPVSRVGQLHRMKVEGRHGPAVLKQLIDAQEGRCYTCREDTWLEIDFDPKTTGVLAGLCRGCRLILSRNYRDADLLLRRVREFRKGGDAAKARRYLVLWQYQRQVDRLRESPE